MRSPRRRVAPFARRSGPAGRGRQLLSSPRMLPVHSIPTPPTPLYSAAAAAVEASTRRARQYPSADAPPVVATLCRPLLFRFPTVHPVSGKIYFSKSLRNNYYSDIYFITIAFVKYLLHYTKCISNMPKNTFFKHWLFHVDDSYSYKVLLWTRQRDCLCP